MRRNRAAADDEDLDITPMIDVTFLLLIFFMVSSTMQGKPDMPLPQAESVAEDLDIRQAVVVTLLAEDGNPTVLLGDGPSAPQGTQEQVAQYVADGVAQQKSVLVIKADKDLPSGFVEDIARAGNVEGITELYFGIDKPRQ